MTISRRSVLGLIVGALSVLSPFASAQSRYSVNGLAVLNKRNITDGQHSLGKAGQIDVSVEVSGGKIATLTAAHPTKGKLDIGKVKTTENLLPSNPDGPPRPKGWLYAFWFTDDVGVPWYYWFPEDSVVVDDSWAIFES